MMKRINLISKKVYFPLPLMLQKRLATILFILLVFFTFARFYKLYNAIKFEKGNIAAVEIDIQRLKLSLQEGRVIEEKDQIIEKEFSDIAADYSILKKNLVIKDVLLMLSENIPHNTWITNIDFFYDSDKKLIIQGNSVNKEEVFTFLNNLTKVSKNAELLDMQHLGENFSFNIVLELL